MWTGHLAKTANVPCAVIILYWTTLTSFPCLCDLWSSMGLACSRRAGWGLYPVVELGILRVLARATALPGQSQCTHSSRRRRSSWCNLAISLGTLLLIKILRKAKILICLLRCVEVLLSFQDILHRSRLDLPDLISDFGFNDIYRGIFVVLMSWFCMLLLMGQWLRLERQIRLQRVRLAQVSIPQRGRRWRPLEIDLEHFIPVEEVLRAEARSTRDAKLRLIILMRCLSHRCEGSHRLRYHQRLS